jgi:SAM-dependent methyltransferase
MSLTSIIRNEENYYFDKTKIKGTVLDLGGTKESSYLKKHLNDVTKIVSVNMDGVLGCDVAHDLEVTPLPFDSNSYDCVVANNTLEHIFNVKELLQDINRILKPSGVLVFTVPFMFPYHSSPQDYWRFTPDSLSKLLEVSHFKNVEIKHLGSGLFTSTFHFYERLCPKFLHFVIPPLRCIFRAIDSVFLKIVQLSKKTYKPTDYSIGYFVYAERS